jgi:CheY-like chemotaxis protein
MMSGPDRKLVLIVDDTPTNVAVVSGVLKDLFKTKVATNGEKALAIATAAEKPDLILLDVMMPGMDGWQVLEELLDDERTNDIPIIFLTARAEVRDQARGLELGGVDYITKPFSPVDLAPLVEDLLERVQRGEGQDIRRKRLEELRRLVVGD